MILRLGSGEAAARGCGSKATLLDRAARKGLPVPAGVIVPDEAWGATLERGLARVDGAGGRRSVAIPDPPGLMRFLELDALTGLLAVRSAFSAEDRPSESLAGLFASGLFVDSRAPAAVAAALAGVWASAFRRPGRFRRDMIVQSMVAARRAGVAFTERDFEDDLVSATFGTAERLLAGEVPGETLALPKLRRGEGGTERDPVAARLQLLLRDVRHGLGGTDWDVEWADDGRRCWLVQVRPITRPPRRNEAFTFAGHRGILPDPPSRFMTSLIASCADGLFAYYRRLDPGLPERRPILEVFRGRPFLNLSLLTEMLRRWGLPTRLVTDSIGGRADRPFGARPGRLARSLGVIARFGLAQVTLVSSARRAERAILERTARPASSLGEAVETLRFLYATLVAEMLSLTTAMTGVVAVLRRAGALAEMAGRWRSARTQMRDDLAALHRLATGSEAVLAALERGQLPEDPAFRRGFEAWLARHGHRGVYESDIARPRYREQPALVLRSLATAPPSASRRRRSARALLLAPAGWLAARALRARESLRSTAMIGFERLRSAMLDRARTLAVAGALPSADALWSLQIDEARRLDEGFRPDATFWRLRAAEEASLREYDFPDVFHRFDDLEAFRRRPEGGPLPVRLHGIPLTAGVVRGRAWVLAEPSGEPPGGFRRDSTILVARAADAGWIPTLALVAAVVVEIGGDLSHGSIVLREIGLPAITNVPGATRAFRTGDWLLVRADEGTVERVEA